MGGGQQVHQPLFEEGRTDQIEPPVPGLTRDLAVRPRRGGRGRVTQIGDGQFQFDPTAAVEHVGIPCVVKPVMSSSGKGQSVIKTEDDVTKAWDYAQEGGRTGAGRVIVEGFIDFDYEITLLTVRAVDGVHFCAPIGHRQEDGDDALGNSGYAIKTPKDWKGAQTLKLATP